MKSIIFVVIFILNLNSSFSNDKEQQGVLRSGTDVGNGVFLIKYKNGKIELADSYFPSVNPNTYQNTGSQLSESITKSFAKIRSLFNSYGITSDYFWDNIVFGEKVQYIFVDKLPCQGELQVDNLSPDAQVFSPACTVSAWETYILEDEFINLPHFTKMLVLIHERLHAFYGTDESSHKWISPFIQRLSFILDLQDKQLRGNRDSLSSEQVQMISDFRDYADILGFDVDERFEISKQGGGSLVNHSLIDQSTFISIGSLISIRPNQKIQKSTIISSAIIYSNIMESKIIFSSLFNSRVNNTYVYSTRVKKSVLEKSVSRNSNLKDILSVNSWILSSSLINSILENSRSFKCQLRRSELEEKSACVESKAESLNLKNKSKLVYSSLTSELGSKIIVNQSSEVWNLNGSVFRKGYGKSKLLFSENTRFNFDKSVTYEIALDVSFFNFRFGDNIGKLKVDSEDDLEAYIN